MPGSKVGHCWAKWASTVGGMQGGYVIRCLEVKLPVRGMKHLGLSQSAHSIFLSLGTDWFRNGHRIQSEPVRCAGNFLEMSGSFGLFLLPDVNK